MATEKQFRIHLGIQQDGIRGMFHLAPNEFLTGSEPGWPDWIRFHNRFRPQPTIIHRFAVRELYTAVQNALKNRRQGDPG